MRIVVFTTNYPPLINPRSFRIGKMVEKLSEQTEFLVITSKLNGKTLRENKVIRCGLNLNVNPSYRNSLKQFAIIGFFQKWMWPDDKILHQVLYFINYVFSHRKRDDEILTVSNPISSHLIGLTLNKFWKHKWTMDIGDIYFGNQHHSVLSKSLERMLLHNCNKIIVNSESLKIHFLVHYKIPGEKIKVIPNGIYWDISKIKPISSDQLRLSYVGNTYADVREATEELKILIDIAKTYPLINIKIHLFGIQFYKVDELSKEYPHLIQISHCKNEDEIITAYSNTDILINFANRNNPGLPSKLQEYLATRLSILNFIYSTDDSSYNFLNLRTNRVLHVFIDNYQVEEILDFIKK